MALKSASVVEKTNAKYIRSARVATYFLSASRLAQQSQFAARPIIPEMAELRP